MRIWSLTMAFLLGGAILTAHADYFRFVYIPNAVSTKDKDKDKNKGIPGMPVRPGQPGLPGQPPGFPGMPMRPGFPMQMIPGQNPNKDAKPVDEEDSIDLTHARMVIVESRKAKALNGTMMIWHKYGITALFQADDIRFRRLLVANRKAIPTVLERYDASAKDLTKEKLRSDPDKILKMAEFAMTHGLYDKFPMEMDELVKVSPRHASAIAYRKVKDDLKRAPTVADSTAAWKDRLGTSFKLATSTHYAALYNARDAVPPAEVNNILKRLEETYQNFFYWFALKGIALPQPDRRLVVVLVDKAVDFHSIHQSFDSPTLSGDGFLARHDNVAFFSMTSLDEIYDGLVKSKNQMWTQEGWNKEELLRGTYKRGEKPDDSAYAQEVALLLRAMQDENELETVTHVGSNQLVIAAGLLPGAVKVPEWLEFGLGSVLETPRGSYWPGVGSPHWKYLVHFLRLRDQNKGGEKPQEILMSILTDRYFKVARQTGNPADLEKARTMAWALTYWLVQDENMREGFMKFLKELAALPRDMDFDPLVYRFCFARAFGLTQETDMAKVDLIALAQTETKLAHTEWYYKYMNQPQIEMADAIAIAEKVEKQRLAKADKEAQDLKNQNRPGFGPNGPGPNPANPMNPGPRRPGR